MDWLMDPNAWIGLLTLIVLEIVLGIDNLIFIAILAEKLPPEQRDRARIIGLSLALFMRLGLLSIMSWLVTLTTPLFSLGPFTFAGRDLILLGGGMFLLVKATTELHERLEGDSHHKSKGSVHASFVVVIAQIVVLDAVFSLDSVITAVGMVDELSIMMLAVMVAIAMMMWASRPLTRFVNAHPTVVVLCLSFLLMIGLSLTAEGLGFKIPKGYLYAAIGFSIMIEFFNQLARRSLLKNEARLPLRDRTAEAVLRLLSAPVSGTPESDATDNEADLPPAFGPRERTMVSSVLRLGDRPLRSIMTPRADISWVNLNDDKAAIQQHVRKTPHSFFPVCRGDLDQIVGVARAKDLIAATLVPGTASLSLPNLRQPIIVHEMTGVMRVMETLREYPGQLVLATDEYGSIQGLVTPMDILEAIAGDFPDEDEQPAIRELGPRHWRVNGDTDLHYLAQVLETDALQRSANGFTSVAGFLLEHFGDLPENGKVMELEDLRFTVVEVANRRIALVDVLRLEPGQHTAAKDAGVTS